jgi:glutaredoxin
MLTLYMRPTCPYCHEVIAAAQELGIELEEKNVADPEVLAELLERGGKPQVPYLVDAERDVEMYESEDIIAYLQEHYRTGE